MFHVKLGGAVRWRRFWMFDGLWRSFQRVNRLSAGVRHSQVARIIIMPTFGWGPKRDANWLKNIFRCRLYATSGNGEQVYDSFSLPSACLCHFRYSWSPLLKKSQCIIKPIFFLVVQGLSLKLDPFQYQEGKQYLASLMIISKSLSSAGWSFFLRTQYGSADKNNYYTMQLIVILPHHTMHRDNFGLKSGFVSSGTKGSSGPRSQLPTCRAGIQLNLPTTGEESKEENAILLEQNAIFLPTTHLQCSHTIISVSNWKGQ